MPARRKGSRPTVDRPKFVDEDSSPAQNQRYVLIVLSVLAGAAISVALLLFIGSQSPPRETLMLNTPTITSQPERSPTEKPSIPTATALPTKSPATPTFTPSPKPSDTASAQPTQRPPTLTASATVDTSRNTPPQKLIPDSELVNSPSVRDLDIGATINTKAGPLRRYSEIVAGRRMNAVDSLTFVSTNTSVNPRLLLALLEYESGWLTGTNSASTHFPMGNADDQEAGLLNQLMWAANTLNEGYYGSKTRGAIALKLRDGTQLFYAAGLNPGSIALQYFFAQLAADRAHWAHDLSAEGFISTYWALFGDPFRQAVEPLLPPNLRQPDFVLPFSHGETWYFSAGPHGGWDRTASGWAAIDFAPPNPPDSVLAAEGKCYVSAYWATSVARGLVVRSGDGAVVVDLDMDGDERTGWTVLYLHIADQDRVPLGTVVEPGSHIGHPSCEGFFLLSPGTHLHIARRYNGEWIVADCKACRSPEPIFNLGGWNVIADPVASLGWLKNGSQIKRLMNGRDESVNGISW